MYIILINQKEKEGIFVEKRTHAKHIILILLGSLILSFGIYNLNYQNNITEGGVLGLLLLLKNLFNIEPSVANLIIDIVLFIIAYKFFGKQFLIHSIIATFSFSIFYEVFEYIGPLIVTILSGLFVGVGVGIIVRNGAAAGGDDALAIIISKITSLNIGNVYMIGDVAVLMLSLTYLSAYDIFWSLIAVNISGRTIDFIYNFNKSKLAKI